MQVVVKDFRGRKSINRDLFVNTNAIARNTIIGSKEANDCVVRAFMSALDIEYSVAHKYIAEKMNRQPRRGTYTCRYLKNVIGKTKNGKKITFLGASQSHNYLVGGDTFLSVTKHNKILTNPKYKKPTGFTVASFMENNRKGRFIVFVKGHAFAVIDGKLYGNTSDADYNVCKRVNYVLEVK